ncbi:MAG: class I SAM-dependent methyltransferase [Candidatus Sumerlaeia bacterium]|nr:class I SAM-dependent methyltransferase [Candidatus Sumerlaeia bacterium]
MGLDSDFDALHGLACPAVRGTLARLPFPDRAFDATVCCEALEHLDDALFEPALHELFRVTKRYILLTVPNDENLTLSCRRCRRCGAQFHFHGHVRSFTADALRGLFQAVARGRVLCREARGIVPVAVFRQSRWLYRLRPEQIGFWIARKGARCPHCGFAGFDRHWRPLFRVWSLALKLANGVLHPVPYWRSCWLLALYEVG